MAEPEFDRSTGWWFLRYRAAVGRRVKKTLLKDPRWSRGGAWPTPGRRPRPPADVLLLARPFQDIDIRVRLGLPVELARATDLAGFLNRYLASYQLSQKPGSVHVLATAITHFLSFASGAGVVALEAVTRAVCRDFLEDRIRAGFAYNTVRGEKGVLGGAWSRAVDEGLIVANPWHRLKIPGKNDSDGTPVWSLDEVERILGQLRGWPRELFLIGIYSGFRCTALRNLRWSDVRWSVPRRKFGVLVCRKQWSKNGKEYAVPLIGPLHDALARLRLAASGPGDLIFPGRNGDPSKPMAGSAFRHWLIKALKAAGVPDRGHHWHAMRKTFATLASARGASPRAIQAWMSHSSLKMTDIYVAYSTDQDDVEAAKLDDGFTPPAEAS